MERGCQRRRETGTETELDGLDGEGERDWAACHRSYDHTMKHAEKWDCRWEGLWEREVKTPKGRSSVLHPLVSGQLGRLQWASLLPTTPERVMPTTERERERERDEGGDPNKHKASKHK